ncbi:hypothetical protein PS663_03370 [Pseudomonas fluorescens]|nr:hypothetical protein PS663_03370 [Pseudomonas fluorescens]
MPSGNFSALSFSNEGLRYQAIQMPRKLTENTQAIMGIASNWLPVSKV